MLKTRGAFQPPYMGCDAAPPVGWGVSWVGGNAVPPPPIPPSPVEVAAPPPVEVVPTMSPEDRRENKRFWVIFTNVSVYILFVLFAAYIYDKFRLHAEWARVADHEEDDGFSFSLFGCFEDPKLSLLALCCPMIRWADTMDKANRNELAENRSPSQMKAAPDGHFIKYWPAVFLVATLTALQLYVGGAALFPFMGCVFSIAMLIVAVLYRQRMRRRAEIKRVGSCSSITEDFFTWLCCPCCAVVQEAREIEQEWGERTAPARGGNEANRR